MSLTVSTLGAEVGLGAATVRYYERLGLLPAPTRTAAGYRQYGPDAIDHRGLSCRDVWSSEVSVDAAGVAADLALVLSGLPP